MMAASVLKCDYDNARFPAFALKRLAVLADAHRLTVESVAIARTRNGWHLAITVRNRVSFARVVLLQALLGSDWKRETFNSRRALVWRNIPREWRTRANVLYTRHYKISKDSRT